MQHHELNGVPKDLNTYRLKVVPKSDPNGDGRWISVTCPKYSGIDSLQHFSRHVDAGEFLVKVENADDDLVENPSPSM